MVGPRLDLQMRTARRQSRQQSALDLWPILGMNQLKGRGRTVCLTTRLQLALLAKPAGPVERIATDVPIPDAHLRAIQRQAQSLLTLAHGGFGLFPRGHVTNQTLKRPI